MTIRNATVTIIVTAFKETRNSRCQNL